MIHSLITTGVIYTRQHKRCGQTNG